MKIANSHTNGQLNESLDETVFIDNAGVIESYEKMEKLGMILIFVYWFYTGCSAIYIMAGSVEISNGRPPWGTLYTNFIYRSYLIICFDIFLR